MRGVSYGNGHWQTTFRCCVLPMAANGLNAQRHRLSAWLLPQWRVLTGTLMIYAGEKIHSSTDGNTWTSVIPNTILKTLVGGGNGEIYAIGSTGTIMVSKDNGATWVQDDMESDIYVDNSKYLPASDVSIITADTKTNSGITRATMVGNKNYTGADDISARRWYEQGRGQDRTAGMDIYQRCME